MFKYFLSYPYLALLPALAFYLLYRQGWPKIILGGSVVWLVYSLYEISHSIYCHAHAPCIRIDMMVVPPLLSVLSAVFLILGFMGKLKRRTPQ